MNASEVDQYFELFLDLPERERQKLLARLDRQSPEVAARLRQLMDNPFGNRDFSCQVGVSGERRLDFLHHVAIQVDDIERAIAWYRNKFGCEVEYRDRSWGLLRFANLRVALVLPDRYPPHFALARQDATRFGELHEHRDGTRAVYLQDPWGNTVEVLDSDSLAQ